MNDKMFNGQICKENVFHVLKMAEGKAEQDTTVKITKSDEGPCLIKQLENLICVTKCIITHECSRILKSSVCRSHALFS